MNSFDLNGVFERIRSVLGADGIYLLLPGEYDQSKTSHLVPPEIWEYVIMSLLTAFIGGLTVAAKSQATELGIVVSEWVGNWTSAQWIKD